MTEWYVDGVLGTDGGDPQGTGEGALAFKTIQYAIDDARVGIGDTINVAAATYTEDIDVDGVTGILIKAATLATIVDGGFYLLVDTITTDGFTIKNGRPGPTGEFPAGVAALGSDAHKVINKVIIGVGADTPKSGVFLKLSKNVYIETNEIYGGGRGIMHITDSDGAIIVNNDIHDNRQEGIGPGESKDSVIRCNDIHGNNKAASAESGGIAIYKGSGHKINLNNIYDNTRAGICYYDNPDLDARYNWWGHASGPGGDEAGSGDPIICDHGAEVDPSPWLVAPVAHTKDSVRNTLVGLGKLAAAGGVFNFMAPGDAYDSGIVAAIRAKLEADTGRIGASFKGVDGDGVDITLMAVGNPDTGRYRAILRTPTEIYKVDV